MHKLFISFSLLLCLLGIIPSLAQQTLPPFRVMFWNVENLFDTKHDSLKNDHEFLPDAMRHWNSKRFKKKIDDVARVIVAVGNDAPPALVGLCEVENDYVLKSLTQYSPLKEQTYRYVMTESPDERGIDVALLYQRDQFKPIDSRSIRIPQTAEFKRTTRDILHVSGIIATNDTLDIFVVHLPSRSGGVKESEPFRLRVAEILRQQTDSIIASRAHSQVIIMGDFNDYPTSPSIQKVLEAKPISKDTSSEKLYHLLANQVKRNKNLGSYKYRGQWQLLDHLIVSGNLLDISSPFYTKEELSHIAQFPFLLTDDTKYGGQQPFRTYNGMKYQGGYSDHLPVYADFLFNVNQ